MSVRGDEMAGGGAVEPFRLDVAEARLDDLRDRPLDAAVLREATERIMAALTVLVEQLRGERAPAERFDPRADRASS